MRYLKTFANHTNYEDFTETEAFVKPNVSYCIQQNEVHYNPWTDPRLIVKYNVTDASEPTLLYGYYSEEGEEEYWVKGIDLFDKVEIDGVDASITDLDAASGQMQLSVGEHTVKYTLKDPTSIIGYIFYECSALTSVTIPNSVTSIGVGAFASCISITSVTIPNSVTSIGDEAFGGCNSLTSMIIPNSVTFIRDNVFQECTGLISVTIPNSVTSIGDQAFYGCISLTSMTIPNSVTSIGNSVFGGCSGLTSVTIGNSVTSIGYSAFYGCSDLTSVTIPNSVTYIGDLAFNSCSGLTSIVSLATTAPTIGNNTFNGVKANGTLTVPSGSSGYNVWMSTGNYFLGKYNWTKVEQ